MATQLRAAPLDLDVGRPEVWRDNRWPAMMDRLRVEAPVSYCPDSVYGPYWSVVKYDDIVEVEATPQVYSSASHFGGITIADILGEAELPHFIAMDRPRHTDQRKSVSPAFTPTEIERLSHEIRARTATLLDTLPLGVEFDWVETLSVELTTGMLAIIFDFPWAERRSLTLWSDWAVDVDALRDPVRGPVRLAHLRDCAQRFQALWAERAAVPPATDLISLMVHNATMQALSPMEQLATMILLIVGGNDTTRNSMSGAAVAFDRFPHEYARLLADPGLAANAAAEIIRWQTPLAHMRRTALADVELGGQTIRRHDKVVMWYAAANREEAKFERAGDFVVDRPNARRHLSFGFGIHRCVGARLAEMQLKILFEELVARRLRIAVTGTPERVASSFVNGYAKLPVTLSII